MDSRHAERIEALFHEIVDLTPARRAASLERRCGADAELRRQVESLVAAYEHVTTVFGSLDPRGEAEPAAPAVDPPTHRRYRIARELGRGGMGVVYLAQDLQLERSVALKFLPARLAEDRLARSLLIAEARAAAMLDHPNIATVFEIGESDEGRLFIAMAYYEGETLRDRLERGPLGREEATAITIDVAQGLAAAHHQGLVHRDIKPGNLLITANGRVKILDFGLAERTDPDRTKSTHAMGTLAYMSPEQARGETVDARTDLWSLGVVLYEMLARRRPFAGDSALALLYAILHETPAPLDEAECPPALQQMLDRALAKDPAARYQNAGELLAALQALDAPERPGPAAALPVYLTSFVGREREITQGRAILRTARLVTLTGPPGTGKTRLATRLAAELAGEFRDGAVFVTLAAITDATLFPSALAQALGVRVTWPRPLLEGIATHLREKHLLLVLDNFEQIVQAADQVRALVAACPRLTLLVTSRAPLRLSGEREFPIPPLACPEPDALGSVEAAVAAEATALFVERAAAIQPDFHLNPQNTAAVAEICRRLDGLPLAIELAAARVKVLPPQALLTRLGKRLDLLKGGPRDLPSRHQTLRQAIAWSYDLLDPDGQTLLRRLSVFTGGQTLEAAEAVAGSDIAGGVLEGLASLVDKNLLRQETQSDGEPRFTMLETIRDFGLECLVAAGEEAGVRGAHRDFYLGLVERASADLTGPQQVAWLDQLAREHENLRLAIEWSLAAGDWEPAERLAAGLWRFWLVRGHLSEGRDRLQYLLAVSPAPSPRRPRLLTAAGTLAHNQGDYAAARSFYEESLALSRARGDEATVAGTLNDLGWVAWRQGDYAAARALSEEALALHRRLGDRRGTAHALNNLGWVAHHQGDYAAAAAFHRESLVLREQSGDMRGIGFALTSLGWAIGRQGDVAEAARLLDRAGDLLREVGERQLLAFAEAIGALVRRDAGEPRAALAALDQSIRTFRQIGDRYGLAFVQNTAASAWHDLGEHERADAIATEALALALEIGDRWGTAQAHGTRARIAGARGRPDEAIRWWREALAIWAGLGDRASVAACLDGLADLIGAGDLITGSRLRGAADALRPESGATPARPPLPDPRMSPDMAEQIERARTAGAAMTLEEIVEWALRAPVPRPMAEPGRS
jgi:predicted ATPase